MAGKRVRIEVLFRMIDLKFVSGCVVCMLVAVAGVTPVNAESRMWIDSDASKRRTCPSFECGIIGRFFFRETVVVYETEDGWSRVSEYYSAGCSDGRSAFVDSGRDDCAESNGIRNGEFAEWVRTDFLAATRPDNPG